MSLDTLGALIAPLLVVMILSYIVAENPLYRLAQHILIGVAIGYATVTVIFEVLVPAFVGLGQSGSALLVFLPGLFLAFIYALRVLPAGRWLSNLVLAFVVATVAAVSLGGAVAGLVVPQIMSAAPKTDIASNIVLVVGTVLTLYSFRFTRRAPADAVVDGVEVAPRPDVLQRIGRLWLMFALGAVLAAIFESRVAALVDLLRYFRLPS